MHRWHWNERSFATWPWIESYKRDFEVWFDKCFVIWTVKFRLKWPYQGHADRQKRPFADYDDNNPNWHELWSPRKTLFYAKSSSNGVSNVFFGHRWQFFKPHIDLKMCKEWIQLCGQARGTYPCYKISKKNSFICDEHFDLHQVLDWKINPDLKPIPHHRHSDLKLRILFKY